MSTQGPQADWNDPEYRHHVLETSPWGDQCLRRPAFGCLSKRGLPNCPLKWNNAEKYAFWCLIKYGGDPEGVAEAFNLLHYLEEDEAKYAQKCQVQAATIRRIFPKLQITLQKFELLIRKRWAKKNKAARTAIIQGGLENMPSSHRPDLEFLRIWWQTPDESWPEIKYGHFMLPHINLEDMTKGNTFLRLLNSRVRHEPSLFVLSDLETLQTAKRTHIIPFAFMPRTIDLHSSVSSGRFGAVQDANEEATEAIVRNRALNVTDGLRILQVQSVTLMFLRNCCNAILHDKIAEILDGNIPTQPEPEPLPAYDEKTEGIVWAALQRPYQPPQFAVDLQGMLNQTMAALEEAKDQIWRLREHPLSFATAVAEFRDHSYEYITDALGHPHPRLSDPNGPFFRDVLVTMLLEVHRPVLEWEMLTFFLRRLIEEEERLLREGRRCEFEEEWPDYFEILLGLRLAFDQVMLSRTIERLQRHIAGNPLTRHRFERPSRDALVARLKASENLQHDPLFWLTEHTLDHQTKSEDRVPIISLEDGLVEIQRLVETGNKALRKTLSPLVVRTIAQAGLQADLRSQLTRFRPRLFSPSQGVGFELDTRGFDGERNKALVQLVHSKLEMDIKLKKLLAHADFPISTLKGLVFPLDERFEYPDHKRPTREITMTMQKAEANLDEFWATFDKAIAAGDEGLAEHFKGIFPSQQQLYRTPDWVEPVTDSSSVHAVEPVADWVSAAPLPEGRADVLGETGKKEKVKTRGVADPSRAVETTPADQGDERDPPPPPPPPPRPVFQLNERAMRVVGVLFYHESAHNQPGSISWADFAYTMTAIGFAARHDYGSAWTFTPTGEKLVALHTQGIIIHAPHPSSKIDFVIARHIGRRLTRKYGLGASSFEQEG